MQCDQRREQQGGEECEGWFHGFKKGFVPTNKGCGNVVIECQYCHIQFNTKRKYKRKYCSVKCSQLSRKRDIFGRWAKLNYPQVTGIETSKIAIEAELVVIQEKLEAIKAI